MLITESQMSIGRQMNTFSLLDNMSYLTEAESVYAPAMVPVVENSRLDSRLINIEDLTTFAESNGIEDLGYALTLVCEASEIDPSTVAFTVDKAALIENTELANLTTHLLNEGINVLAKPISSNSEVAILGEACLNYALMNDDWSLLEAFIQDDFEYLIEYNPFSPNYNKVVKSEGDSESGSAVDLPSSKTNSPTLRNLILNRSSGDPEAIIKAKPTVTRVRPQTFNLNLKEPEVYKSDTSTSYKDEFRNVWDPKTKTTKRVHVSQIDSHGRIKDRVRPQTFNLNLKEPEVYKSDTSTSYKDEFRNVWDPKTKTTKRVHVSQIDSHGRIKDDESTKESNSNTSSGTNTQTSSGSSSSTPTTSEKKTVENTIQNVTKEWKSKPRKWFAEKIAWLHDKAQEFNEKVHKDGKNAPWYKKVLSYITRAIAFLTKKMHNLVAEKGHEIGDSKDGNFAYSSFKKS